MLLRSSTVLTLLLAVAASPAHGQILAPASGSASFSAGTFDRVMLGRISDRSLYGEAGDEPTKGTPYLNPEFVPAIVQAGKQQFTEIPIRYNIYEDYMEFKQEKKTLVLDAQTNISKIESDGLTFVVDSYEAKGKIRLGFFIRLDSGALSMLLKKNVSFRPQQQPKALEFGPTPPTFTKEKNTYYIKIGTAAPVKVESIRKLIANLPDKQTEMTAYAKKEKLDWDSDGLAKLGKYYNSLSNN